LGIEDKIMKWILIGLIAVIGIFIFTVSMGLSSFERNLSDAANTTAVEVLGSNYTQFSGMPELFAYWWIAPLFVIPCLVIFAIWKVYKR
jgi:hypothetical protein